MRIEPDQLKKRIPIPEFYTAHLGNPRKEGNKHVYFCCFHEDKNTPNLKVSPDGNWKCFACSEGGDVFDFFMKLKKLDFPAAMKTLSEQYWPDHASNCSNTFGEIVAEYPYRKEDGTVWFEVVRFEPKTFKQRIPVGNGEYQWGLGGRVPILYRLPELIKGPDPVFICEGEKDADCLADLGLTSTTCPMGAGKWRVSFNHYLKNREVVILPDNDEPGRKHSEKIANSLHIIAASLKIVSLPELPEHGDVSDYLDSRTKEEFLNEVKTAPPYKSLSLFDQLPTWNEMREMEINVEWVVNKVVPAQAITVLFGRGGIGKSWLSFDMARSIGNGISFLERTTKKLPVVIVDFENPLSVIKARTEKLGEAENVNFWKDAPKLDTADWVKYKELPKDAVLIFDTLRAAHSGDENTSRDMALVMDRIKQLRDSGFTIILIHHTAKGAGNSAKGSTAIVDMADHALNLSIPNSPGSSGNNPEEILEVGADTIYRFGWREKTRFEPFECFLKLNPERGFELAPDPKENQLKEMQNILNDSGPTPKTEFVERVHSETGLSKAKVRDLISRGDGRYWEIEKGAHNLHLVKPIQFSSFPGPIEGEKLKNYSKEPEPIENKEVYVEDL